MSLKPCLFCFYMATSLYSVFTVMYGMYHLRTYAVWLGTRELCSTDGRRQATVTIRRDNQGFIQTNQPPSRTGLHSVTPTNPLVVQGFIHTNQPPSCTGLHSHQPTPYSYRVSLVPGPILDRHILDNTKPRQDQS